MGQNKNPSDCVSHTPGPQHTSYAIPQQLLQVACMVLVLRYSMVTTNYIKPTAVSPQTLLDSVAHCHCGGLLGCCVGPNG